MAPRLLDALSRGAAEPCHPQVDELRNLINSSVDPGRLRRLRHALIAHAAHSYYSDLPESARRDLAEQATARLSSLRAQARHTAAAAASSAPRPVRPPAPQVQIDLALFGDASRLPRRPYCTDCLEYGTRIRGLASALSKKYIQANPPWMRIWSIFDVDRPGGGLAWEATVTP
jgi:hypothetical protein